MAPGNNAPVVLVDVELLKTGQRWDGVRLEHPDYTEYELAAQRHNWPPIERGASLWGSFVAHAALLRLGEINGSLPFEAFRKQARISVHETPETVDPTQPVADSDSA